MEFLKLECPNCHAQLSIENRLDTFFCQYCGSKIILSGQNPEIVRAKVEMHKTDTEAELTELRLQKEYELKQLKEKNEFKLSLIPIYMFVGIMLMALLMAFLNGEF